MQKVGEALSPEIRILTATGRRAGSQDPGRHMPGRPAGGAQVSVAPAPVGLDKPIYTISVASEILETHPRTLMMYEHLNLIVPYRTSTNRRRYSQRDILALQAIQRLTRQHGLNLNGARYVIQCLRLLDEHGIERPPHLDDIDVSEVRL
jgi:DNA-binding transcriptional MerR regulator